MTEERKFLDIRELQSTLFVEIQKLVDKHADCDHIDWKMNLRSDGCIRVNASMLLKPKMEATDEPHKSIP